MDRGRVRNLIEALLERQPSLVRDPTFLRRALVVEGVASFISPVVLELFFGRYGDVTATVLLRDAARGERVGMLVFAVESDCLDAAEEQAIRPGTYWRISKVAEVILQNPVQLLKDAVEQQSRRSSTAEAFRLMIPQRYLEEDDQEDLHLRCLLLRMAAASTATPRDLYVIARTTLTATGGVCALVVYRSRRMAMVVFDDSRDIERCGNRSTKLFALRLTMYDSGLFPLVAYGVRGHGDLAMRDQLPLFCRSSEFLGCVIVLRGPGIAECDAGEMCYRIEVRHLVEALLVHCAEQLAVVVLRSREDADALTAESGEFWRRACATQLITTQVIEGPSPPFIPRPLLQFPEVVSFAPARIHSRTMQRSMDDSQGLARSLVEFESLRRGNHASAAAILRAIRSRRELRRLRRDGGGLDHE